MLTRIGAHATPEDAAGLLLECHIRIRAFLALSRWIAEAVPSERTSVVEAASSVVRYFTQALPLHARDEEDSVLPRLRGRDPAVDDALAAMQREHRAHEAPLGALVATCATLAHDPSRLAALSPALSRTAAQLEAHFSEHLRREEAVILPAMRRLLTPSEDAAVLRELRGRRAEGVAPLPELAAS